MRFQAAILRNSDEKNRNFDRLRGEFELDVLSFGISDIGILLDDSKSLSQVLDRY